MSEQQATENKEAFLDKLLGATRGAFEIFGIYLGDRLGYYRALRDGPLTSGQLAERTGTVERYAREWLEHQTVTGILTVVDANAPVGTRQFTLPPGHDEVLTDTDSLDYAVPLAQMVAGAVAPMQDLLTAYKTGGGVPYSKYGAEFREGQGRINRAAFLQLLGSEWIPTMSDVHARLSADPPARIADIGCGASWSAIGIARTFPNVLVDGFDLDGPSVDIGRKNVADAGLSDRITLHVRDAGDPELSGKYDLVMAFECVHDMSDPVAVLSAMQRMRTDGGAVLIADERVGDEFTAAGNDVEWMMYGWSILHCLPVCKADEPSAETGTVMRTSTLRKYAEQAGFESVEILPIENFFFRFYRLR